MRDILIDCVSLTSLIISVLPSPDSLDYLPARRRLRSLRVIEDGQDPNAVRVPRRNVWLHGECFPLLRDVVFFNASPHTRLQYLPHLESLAAIYDPGDRRTNGRTGTAPCLDLKGTRGLRRLNLASSSQPWVLSHAELPWLETLSYRHLSSERPGQLPAELSPNNLPRLKRIHLEHCFGPGAEPGAEPGRQHLDLSGCRELEEVVLVGVQLGCLTLGHRPNLRLSITDSSIDKVDEAGHIRNALPAGPPTLLTNETAPSALDPGVLAPSHARGERRRLLGFWRNLLSCRRRRGDPQPRPMQAGGPGPRRVHWDPSLEDGSLFRRGDGRDSGV